MLKIDATKLSMFSDLKRPSACNPSSLYVDCLADFSQLPPGFLGQASKTRFNPLPPLQLRIASGTRRVAIARLGRGFTGIVREGGAMGSDRD